jgi:hypothetical protein
MSTGLPVGSHIWLPLQRSPCNKAGASAGNSAGSFAYSRSKRNTSPAPMRFAWRAIPTCGSSRQLMKNSAQVDCGVFACLNEPM